MRLIFQLISIIFLIRNNQAANILGIFPLAGKSHYVMFERIFSELAARGHNVDIVTHFPIENPPPRFNQLSIRGSVPIYVNNVSIDSWPSYNAYEMIPYVTEICGYKLCEEILKTRVLQELKSTKKKYDLVITHIFGSDCMIGFGYHYKVPTVSLITSVPLPWANDRIGNPDNPSYIANYYYTNTHKMDLFGRIQNFLLLIYSKIIYNLNTRHSNRVIREFFGPDLPDLQDLIKNTSLILANSYFIGNQARPTVPNFVEVGGVHIKKPQPLPKHLDDLIQLDANTKGVIYLTMGSMVLSESLPVQYLQAMFDAFAELPYKVLWKATRERFPEGLRFPENIYFEPWVPQLDILCHPNVKLFVSHGGLLGTQESMYCGVPRIGIPIFADQVHNIRNSEELGVAIKVDYRNISKQSILEAATRILTDPKYQQNAKRIATQFKDRPVSALDAAIFWIEYVIKYHGAPELRSRGADLVWYQYYLIDVIIVLLLSIIFLVRLITILTKLIIRLIVNSLFKTKLD